ncbi:MAG: response regulator [Ruminococcaceae bacterium]|nr:response regulator [Oscillospiraceae bacterium]
MYLALCDDQRQELDMLQEQLERWQQSRHTVLRCKTFDNADALLDAARKEHFDLYFLDVLMPGLTGMDAAREIREFDDAAHIVFLTSAPGFAYESYGVKALDYLLKPVEEERVFALLDRISMAEHRPKEGMTIKCGATVTRILFSQLVYVEVNSKHLYFHMADGHVKEVYGTLRQFGPQLLQRPEFMQIHRSYIMNMLQVAELSPAGVRTFSGENLPVSRLLYTQLQKDYIKLLFDSRDLPE